MSKVKSIYTVIDDSNKEQTFEGFKCHSKKNIKTKLLAVCYIVGEVWEEWLLDDLEALEELKRYYRMEMGEEPEDIQVFKRMKV